MKRQKTKINWKPALFAAAGMVALSAGAYTFLKPPVFARHLSVRPTVEQLKNGDELQINETNPGEQIDIRRHFVRGKYTIFDFQSVHCPSCRQLSPFLLELTKFRPDIALRSVDVDRPGSPGIDWGSPLCKQYHIGSVPHFKVFGPEGNLLLEGRQASDQVIKLVNEELIK